MLRLIETLRTPSAKKSLLFARITVASDKLYSEPLK